MSHPDAPPLFLVVDDDPADQRLILEAMKQTHLAADLRFVGGGEELLEYLRRTGRHAPPADAPAPRVVLLDLNMPGKNGLEALRELKADLALRHIPVVVLTTSASAADVQQSYRSGASAYFAKPAAFADLVTVLETLAQYWIATVQVAAIPEPRNHAC